MAKLSDREDIMRMTWRARKRNDLDLHYLILDKNRLCPGCGKPIKEQPGEPRMYMGEKFCAPCIDSHKENMKSSGIIL
jgi:hypothetical protein